MNETVPGYGDYSIVVEREGLREIVCVPVVGGDSEVDLTACCLEDRFYSLAPDDKAFALGSTCQTERRIQGH